MLMDVETPKYFVTTRRNPMIYGTAFVCPLEKAFLRRHMSYYKRNFYFMSKDESSNMKFQEDL